MRYVPYFFFDFFSPLSKEAAQRWQHYWEIVILVSSAVLAVGAIGEYLEEHHKFPRLMSWLRRPKLMFLLMVVLSLIGEFGGDAGVYRESGRLQEVEDAELKKLGANADVLEQRLTNVKSEVDGTEIKAGLANDKAERAGNTAGDAQLKATAAIAAADELRAETEREDLAYSASISHHKFNPRLLETLKQFPATVEIVCLSQSSSLTQQFARNLRRAFKDVLHWTVIPEMMECPNWNMVSAPITICNKWTSTGWNGEHHQAGQMEEDPSYYQQYSLESEGIPRPDAMRLAVLVEAFGGEADVQKAGDETFKKDFFQIIVDDSK